MRTLFTDWKDLLKGEFQKDYYKNLMAFLKEEYANHTVYPEKENIFRALNLTSYKDVSVCILGQDPYPGVDQAHGLSFSVNIGVDIPKSLQNIYAELQADCGCFIPNNGYLESWAKQGVLLLNTVLTVRGGAADSHKGKGWEIFTDRIIELLNEKEDPLVFLLWGNNARAKKALLTNENHLVLESPHPSPLSAHRGFLGSRQFSKANAFLTKHGRPVIDWQIQNV